MEGLGSTCDDDDGEERDFRYMSWAAPRADMARVPGSFWQRWVVARRQRAAGGFFDSFRRKCYTPFLHAAAEDSGRWPR